MQKIKNWARVGIAALIVTLSSGSLMAAEMTDEQIEKADYKKLLKTLTPMKGSTPAQWRVVWSGDASRTATISWSTAVKGSKHLVHIGTSAQGKQTAKYDQHLASTKNGVYQITPNDAKEMKAAFYHHCVLKDLKPGTRYHFVIESDGELSRPLYFITCPEKGDFKLIHGGDSRTGLANRCRMNLRIAAEIKKDPSIVGLCHGGDFVVNGRSYRQWRAWMSHNELTTLEDGRVMPIIPTRGNHDIGTLLFEVFHLKKAGRGRSFWNVTSLTDQVNIITLDTSSSAKGAQEQWLEKQLSELRPKSKWLLTNYHKPLFPAVNPPAQQATSFVPLFEKYNVDLALESDGHCIKRTVPIRNGKKDPTGVTYIGEGGLGVSQRSPKKDRWYLKEGLANRGNHIMILTFKEKTLGIEVILLNGKSLDQFTLKAR